MVDIMETDTRYLIDELKLPDLEGARILITGCSGLIGTSLINFFSTLLNSNRYLFEVDAISMHTINRNNKFNENIHFKFGDLSLGLSSFKLKSYDFIIHAATYAQPSKFTAQPIETLNLNGPIVVELTKYLEPNGTFLFLSSSEIYSGSLSIFNREEDLGALPIDSSRAPYVYGKLFGEVTLMQLKEQFQIRIGRIALSYGPGTKKGDSRVLNQLIHRGLTQGKVSLADPGTAIRTYSYIRDTTQMLLNIIFWGESEIYNIGGVSTVSIRELGEKIATILDVPFEYPEASSNFLEAPKQVKLDIGRYTREFGQLKFIELIDGLHRTIDWQRAEHRIGDA